MAAAVEWRRRFPHVPLLWRMATPRADSENGWANNLVARLNHIERESFFFFSSILTASAEGLRRTQRGREACDCEEAHR